MTTVLSTAHTAASTRRKIAFMYGALALINLFAWLWAWTVLRSSPALIGTAFLAYSFGLRHAMDADHIAAIDNVTRKLVNDGKRPICVGFFFALGHSLMVVVSGLSAASQVPASFFIFSRLELVGAGGSLPSLSSQ